MNKMILTLGILATFLVAPLAVTTVSKMTTRLAAQIAENPSYQKQSVPDAQVSLESNSALPKKVNVKRTITLEAANVVTFKGPVTDESVSQVMRELQDISRKNTKDTDLFLVLDTPGGSIPAGMDLIDFAKSLPQKVHTVTLFAASMGFMIAQNLDNRYVTNSGMLMSHRARLSGCSGQINGEFESCYKVVRRAVDYLDVIASERLQTDIETYRSRTLNELWVYGFDALENKVADEVIAVKCGESLSGTFKQTYQTFFGDVVVTFNKCPLIKAPEAITLKGSSPIDAVTQFKAEQEIRSAFINQEKFVREVIVTGRFNTIFK